MRTGEADVPQVGIVTSRRSVGGAVQRNRVRRRIRAALDRMDIPRGVEMIVIADRVVADVPFATLVGWLEEAMKTEEHDDD
jgi:ribonuclease P protein component